MIKMIKQAFGLYALRSLFDNDEHYIISKRGWEILNEEHNNTGWVTISDYKRSLGR